MDGKLEFINKFECSLLGMLSVECIKELDVKLLTALEEFDIVKKCKELVVYNDYNQQLLIEYASDLMLGGKAERTIKNYVREINLLIDYCGKPLNEVLPLDVKSYIANALSRGVSKTTANNSRNNMASFFSWMHTTGRMANNPCENIKAIKCEKTIKGSFTDVELDKLRSCTTNIRDRAIIELLVSSGVRVSELINLNISDLDLSSLKVFVRQGKGGKDRITYMSRVAAHYISDYIRTRTDSSPAVFITKRNLNSERIGTDGIRWMLQDLGKRAGVADVHPHKFRHTFATMMYNKGMDLHEIQRLLGHESIETTLTYISSDNMQLETSYMKRLA